MAFRVQQQHTSQLLRPALAVFDGEDDDDPAADATALAVGHAANAGARSNGTGIAAPPPPSTRGSKDELKQKGVDAAQAGQYATALHAFGQALLHGEDAHLEEMRAQVLLLLGRDFEAVQAAEHATRLSPEWAEGWLTLARANLNLGEPQLAVESLQRLADIDPGHQALREELPEAQMLAARQRQQQGSVRMQVLPAGAAAGEPAGEGPATRERGGGARRGGGAGAGAAGGGSNYAGYAGAIADGIDSAPMDGVDMTQRVWMPNAGVAADKGAAVEEGLGK